MYVCPECGEDFEKEESIKKHFLACWKERHTQVKSKSAPHSEDVVTREDNQDILNFFNSFN